MTENFFVKYLDYLYLCTEEIKTSNLYAMKAKPFIKWVGGKSQLIEQLEAKLPADFDNWENVTYIEPFVGGGAMVLWKMNRL